MLQMITSLEKKVHSTNNNLSHIHFAAFAIDHSFSGRIFLAYDVFSVFCE